jgi:hypothetical protein
MTMNGEQLRIWKEVVIKIKTAFSTVVGAPTNDTNKTFIM